MKAAQRIFFERYGVGIERWAKEYADNLVVLGINVNDSTEDVENFCKKTKLNYPVLLAENSKTQCPSAITSAPRHSMSSPTISSGISLRST